MGENVHVFSGEPDITPHAHSYLEPLTSNRGLNDLGCAGTMSWLQPPETTASGSSCRLWSLPEVVLCEGVLACLDVVSLGRFTLTCHHAYKGLNTCGLWGGHVLSLWPSFGVACIPSSPTDPSLTSLLQLLPTPQHRHILAKRLTRSGAVRVCGPPLLSSGGTVLHVEMYEDKPTSTQGLVGTSVYSCVLPLAHLPSLTASLYTPHTYTPHTLTGAVCGGGLGEVLSDNLEAPFFSLTIDVAAIDLHTTRVCRVQEWGSLRRVHCWSLEEEGAQGEGAVWRILLDDGGTSRVVSCPGPFNSTRTHNTRLDLSFCPSLDIRQDEAVSVLCAPLELRLIDADSEQYHDEHPQLAHSRADFAMAALLKPLLHYLAGLTWTAA